MTDDTPQIPPENEPTVLDLYKSVTKDWPSFFNFIRSLWDARRRAQLDHALAMEVAQNQPDLLPEEPVSVEYFPWRSVLARFLALGAQALLEPPNRQVNISLALYILAAGICIWAYLKNEWHLSALPAFKQMPDDLSTRVVPFLFSIVFAALAILGFWWDGFSL